jgi:hypothetical protein
MYKKMIIFQCCKSGYVSGIGSGFNGVPGSVSVSGFAIRIRIHNPDPDPRGKK